MNNTVKNYLFLGLPKSGKTTYFSLMAQHLQDVANKTNNLKFLFLPTIVKDNTGVEKQQQITSRFINDCMMKIKKRRWPVKTQSYDIGYSFELNRYFSFMGKPLLQKYFYMKAIVDYHDYPGEAFEVAFGDLENKNIMDNIKNAAEDMKSRIASANGIFLILDTDALFKNDSSDEMLGETLENLFAYVKNTAPNIKIAVIFNKLELFDDLEIDFIKRLRKNYGNVYAHLPYNHKFFYVYTLGSIDTDKFGQPIPPKKIVSRGILEPIKWMLNF